MTKSLIALLALALLPLAGHADEYANRARAAQEQETARRRAEIAARSYQINVFEINKLNRFVSQHGGLVEDGTCEIQVSTCRDGEAPCYFRERATIALSALNPAADYYISTCSLNLRDGLACRVWEQFNLDGTVNSTWSADCYDQNGQSRRINLGAGIGSGNGGNGGGKANNARKVIRRKRGK